MLLFGIALALAFQVLGSGGTIFILSLAAFQLYFLYLMLIVKPQVIRLDDKGLTIPSLFFQGLSFRRVNWSDVKKVYTWGGPHKAPVIRDSHLFIGLLNLDRQKWQSFLFIMAQT